MDAANDWYWGMYWLRPITAHGRQETLAHSRKADKLLNARRSRRHERPLPSPKESPSDARVRTMSVKAREVIQSMSYSIPARQRRRQNPIRRFGGSGGRSISRRIMA